MRLISAIAMIALSAISLTGAESAPEFQQLGQGTAVVFSPDLSTAGNQAFYEVLGFAYFDDANWYEVARGISRRNEESVEGLIDSVIVESHGTNGHGLKLQKSRNPGDLRSYSSIGGLQHALADSGVSEVLISACNSGRLFRPEIYHELDTSPGDPLFLPATNGVLKAPEGTAPLAAEIRMLRRDESRIETLVVGRYDELPPSLRDAVAARNGARDGEFVVSTMLIQRLLRDPALRLVSAGYETRLSRDEFTSAEIEQLFAAFLSFLHAIDSQNRVPPTAR
jgi:hypothetical protein